MNETLQNLLFIIGIVLFAPPLLLCVVPFIVKYYQWWDYTIYKIMKRIGFLK
jgi:hypothetical protein